MPLFSNLRKELSSRNAALKSMSFPQGPTWASGYRYWNGGYSPGSGRNYAAETGDLWKNSVIAICLGWISENFSEPELTVEETKGAAKWEVVAPHALTDLVTQPNAFYDGDDLWAAILLSWWVDGNAYWLKSRDGGGRVRELYYEPHWNMVPDRDKGAKQFLTHYTRTVNGQRERWELEDVIHFRYGIDPTNNRVGMSPLKALLREVYSDNQCMTYSAALLANMGVPGVLIGLKDPGTTFGGQETSLGATYQQKFAGDNVGKAMFVDAMLSVEKLGFSPEELALEKLREVPEARICAALRVPPSVVGLTVGDKQKTYSNLKESREATFENNIKPTQRRFKRRLQNSLLGVMREQRNGTYLLEPELGNPDTERVAWDYSQVAVLQEDETAKHQRAREDFTSDLITRSEARAMLGGYESEEEDDVYYSELKASLAPTVTPFDPNAEEDEEPTMNGNGREAAGNGRGR